MVLDTFNWVIMEKWELFKLPNKNQYAFLLLSQFATLTESQNA